MHPLAAGRPPRRRSSVILCAHYLCGRLRDSRPTWRRSTAASAAAPAPQQVVTVKYATVTANRPPHPRAACERPRGTGTSARRVALAEAANCGHCRVQVNACSEIADGWQQRGHEEPARSAPSPRNSVLSAAQSPRISRAAVGAGRCARVGLVAPPQPLPGLVALPGGDRRRQGVTGYHAVWEGPRDGARVAGITHVAKADPGWSPRWSPDRSSSLQSAPESVPDLGSPDQSVSR